MINIRSPLEFLSYGMMSGPVARVGIV
ncbi:hypothetical protein HNP86_001889 [Methanococcus maripaludis]|uniref:Uncharacterized protein n=1 Tax=Methanococcus maripaludis TaxID=39152 RepID=A0A7J9NVM6_METMI|nr:hypothetical protein [Methanococcus maripaludis]